MKLQCLNYNENDGGDDDESSDTEESMLSSQCKWFSLDFRM